MTKRSSQVIHKAPGRIGLVKNSGAVVSVNLTHRLPDGSRLTDPANKHLLDTILGVITASVPRLAPSSMSSIAGSLYILVQWMFLRSIYRFGSLKKHHFKAYLEDAAKGLDHCIKATPRLRAHLETLKRLPTSRRRSLKVKAVFEEAGIPPTNVPRLPHLATLVRDFAEHGSVALKNSEKTAKRRTIGKATLRSRVRSLEMLWEHRSKLVDPATVEPISHAEKIAAQSIGAPGTQTKVAPKSIALQLYVGAMNAIMNIAPAAIEWHESCRHPGRRLVDDAQSFERLSRLVADHWQCTLLRKVDPSESHYLLTRSLMARILPMACQITILAYVGRRKVEVESLESTCIAGTASEGRTLSSYIAKRQAYESRPCPEIVARAVDFMTRYHGYTAHQPGALFNQRGKSTAMPLAGHFDQFGELIGALAYEDIEGHERRWHWAPHQLRRLYVVIYIWRYEDSSYLALRHHLGHGSEAEAAFYAKLASDENFSELAEEAGIFTAERLREVARGELVGGFADVLTKRIERVRANLRLSSANGLESIIKHLIEEEQLVMHASLWGYCGCKATPSNMRRAKCRQGRRAQRPKQPVFNTPIPEDSDEATCSGCIFFSTGPSRKTHWQNLNFRLKKAVDAAPDGSLVAKLMKQSRAKVEAATSRLFGDSMETRDARKQ